ncbi:MAG: deoxycytidine triphosphate deaminase [Candidatus Saccharibacteria bacterium GW2011_GWA2_46_10]|nr:MAG: deoxycytidine triphosphate deaminase [Candidatus Saccharibacteria bacterium GW2011_GWA2_46_10]OGL35597.1 MAG: deoxycytidine triphosphate deaminase [Candidatus Saccharibacteria bacterium RIFCSPHIGHO2_12_FULL_47_17]
MGVYSNLQIRQAVAEGHIVCRPFNPKHVSYASLDVTLGHYYYRTEKVGDKRVYNPFDKSDVLRYFEGPYQAVRHKDWCQLNGVQLLAGIPANHLVIPLKPGERLLGHTHEFFGIKPPGAFELKSRSSWGRNGIAVCFDAGWVDPGYINRLTLEIYNLNQKDIILLPVGERIAQAVFHETGPVEGSYGIGRGQGFSGKYQSGSNLDKIIKQWSPDQMLPKAYKDSRTKPPKIEGLKAL